MVLIDDPVSIRDAYASGEVHIGWATLDMVPLFMEELKKDSRMQPRIFQQVDWSNGGDGIVIRRNAAKDPQHPPTEGSVKVWGEHVTGPGSDRGMVFQDYTSFSNRTVLDNVAFGLECQGVSKSDRYEQAIDWIAKVGLDPDHDPQKYPHQLSGGMKQRVAIAQTLILHPKIILMDQPFGVLDPVTRHNMQDLLVGLWRDLEATVFFITHDVREAVYLGDRIFILSNSPGTILEETIDPAPDRLARDMQREPDFLEHVDRIATKIESLEEGKD